MSKLKVAVIGCGSISKHRHLPEYHQNDEVEIVALCDIVASRAEAVKEVYGGTVYTDYKELLKNETIDLVSVCLPNACMHQSRLRRLKVALMCYVKNRWQQRKKKQKR